MGRYRNPNATTRKRRNIEGRLAREAKLDDLSRANIVTPDYPSEADRFVITSDEDGDEWEYR